MLHLIVLAVVMSVEHISFAAAHFSQTDNTLGIVLGIGNTIHTYIQIPIIIPIIINSCTTLHCFTSLSSKLSILMKLALFSVNEEVTHTEATKDVETTQNLTRTNFGEIKQQVQICC